MAAYISVQDDLSAIDFRRHPKITWTDHKKEFLCLLVKCFKSEWLKFSRIYNTVFARDLQEAGFVDGAPHHRLRGQWVDLRRKSNTIYQNVESSHDLNPEVAKQIDITCQRLNIKLLFREGMAPRFQAALGGNTMERNHVSSKRQKITRETFISRISVLEEDTAHPNPASYFSVPSSKDTSKDTPPRFLFRAWSSESSGLNSKSEFVAGLWADDPRLISDPIMDSRISNLLSRVHLSRYEVKSPFISLTQNPLDAIRRTMHHQPSYMSIFDTTKIPHLLSAQNILKDDPIVYGTKHQKYLGRNEWLVWGAIPSEGIIATIKIDPMCKLPRLYDDLFHFNIIRKYHAYGGTLHSRLTALNHKATKSDGILLGNVFQQLNLPFTYAEELALIIAKAWHLKSNNDFVRFSRGIRLSYGQLLQPENLDHNAADENEWENESEDDWEDI